MTLAGKMTIAGKIMDDVTNPRPAGIKLTPEQLRARRARSIAIALALGAFVLVIFAVTIVRLGSATGPSPDYMRPVQPTQ
jgi:hypothetical protein